MLQIVSQLRIKSPCVYRPPLLVSDVVFMSLPLLKTTFLMIKLSPTSWLPISLSLSLSRLFAFDLELLLLQAPISSSYSNFRTHYYGRECNG